MTYFVEIALTANHCGCQILNFQSKDFQASMHLLQNTNLTSIFVNYLVSLLFYFIEISSVFTSKQTFLYLFFFFNYKTHELLSC